MKLIKSILIVLLIITGCGEKKDEPAVQKDELIIDTTDVVTTPVENPDESFLLRYGFKTGKDYKYRLATITESIQTMTLDTTITTKINQNVVYRIDIKSVQVDEDSTLEVTCTFKSVKIDADANGQKFSFQSGVTTDSLEIERFAEYVVLINNPFNLRINKTGEIVEIFRTDKILSSFLDMKGAADEITPEQKNMVKEQIVEGGIKPLLMQIFRRIPEQQIAKDSTWSFPQPATQLLVFDMQSVTNYSVSGLENLGDDKVAVVNASLDTKITGNTKVTEQGVTYDFKKPVSEASGKIYFNITEGCIKKSNMKTKIVISYTMEGDTPQGKQKGTRTESMEYNNIVELL